MPNRRSTESSQPPSSPVNGGASPQAPPPLAEAIRDLAYAYWEAEGRPDGAQMRNWLRAEAVVRRERGLPPVEEDDAAAASTY